MKPQSHSPLIGLVQRLLSRLRYPYLFLILGGLFLIDLVVPDPIFWVDELMLLVLTILAASFTNNRDATPPPKDVTPNDDGERLSGGQLPSRTQTARSPARDEES